MTHDPQQKLNLMLPKLSKLKLQQHQDDRLNWLVNTILRRLSRVVGYAELYQRLQVAADTKQVTTAVESKTAVVAKPKVKPEPTPAKPKSKRLVGAPQLAAPRQVASPKPSIARALKDEKKSAKKPATAPKPPKEPKEDSATGREVRRYLQEARPPFTRVSIFKELKWQGSLLTQAAVSGWVGRAVKRGELVMSPTTPGEYYLKGYCPAGKAAPAVETKPSRPQLPPVEVVVKEDEHKAPVSPEIKQVMDAIVRGEVSDFDLVSGAGGLG